MSKVIVLDRNVWGPLGWHVIHNFSIKSTDNDCMNTLIRTFGYILPCPTCKKHYNYLITNIYIINDNINNKKGMIKYLYDIHNIINKNLEKKIKISLKESIEVNKKIDNPKFIYFLIIIYSNINYKKISFNEFDKIYNFFICFLKNYPSKEIRVKFTKIINSKDFIDSDTPMTFHKWFHKKFKKINFINENYEKYNKKIINNI